MPNVINQNGKTIDFQAAVMLMDEEIRETLANDGNEYNEQEFFSAYERAHESKYGDIWELSKSNPTW